MRGFLGTFLAGLAAFPALGQQGQQGMPTFSESVEVRVLNLDVDVTDSQGHPVPDLKREDFTLKIGGKAVPIDYFTRVDEGVIHAPDLATASPDQVLATYRKGEEAYVPRNFLMFIDLGYLPPGLRTRSLEAMRDLVTRLGPSDGVRVVTFDRAPRVVQDWTTSKELALAALSDVERQGVGMSRLQSQQQAIALMDQTPRSRRAIGYRLQIAQQYAAEIAPQIRDMIASMRQELVTLTPLHGKKAFLFLTGGFEYQPGFVMSQYATGGFPSLENVNVRDVPQHLNELIRDANSNLITFYTVDATGLTGEGTPASHGTPLSNQIGFENRPSVTFQARQDRQTGMLQMATDTGGLALLNTNDFQRGLSRVYRDVSTYYTIGTSLSKLGITTYENVQVEVARPGVTVRARRGYRPLPESQAVIERARATLETDLTYGAIPVELKTAAPALEKKLYVLPVTVLVPASSLTFLPGGGGRATAKAEIYVGSVDDRGRTSEISKQDTSFDLAEDKVKTDTPLAFETRLQTKKGNYRVVVNVRDPQSGRMGTGRVNVHVE
jgi:VWFA-related protein